MCVFEVHFCDESRRLFLRTQLRNRTFCHSNRYPELLHFLQAFLDLKSATCKNRPSFSNCNLTHREVPVNQQYLAVIGTPLLTYINYLLPIIGTCNESEVEACRPRDAGAYK